MAVLASRCISDSGSAFKLLADSRKGTTRLALVLVLMVPIVVSSVVVYSWLYFVAPSPPSPPIMSEHLEISASCTPTGSTGNILAINRGNTAVNITQLSVRNATGGLVFITSFRYGFVIYAGHNSTLASGFPYQGNNVTILAVSNRGNLFETMCPPIA